MVRRRWAGSGGVWLVEYLFAATCVAFWIWLIRAWRNERLLPRERGWALPEPYWRAMIRTSPAAALTCSVAVMELILSENERHIGSLSPVLTWVLMPVLIASIVVSATVLLANKPGWIVVPYLRDLPGLIDDLRSSGTRNNFV